jgi:hypothetical protein
VVEGECVFEIIHGEVSEIEDGDVAELSVHPQRVQAAAVGCRAGVWTVHMCVAVNRREDTVDDMLNAIPR